MVASFPGHSHVFNVMRVEKIGETGDEVRGMVLEEERGKIILCYYHDIFVLRNGCWKMINFLSRPWPSSVQSSWFDWQCKA